MLPRSIIMNLECQLTTDEKVELNKQRSKMDMDRRCLIAKKAMVTSALSADIKKIENDMLEIDQKIVNEAEIREVDVDIIYDRENKIKLFLRSDTGEEVKTEEMTLAEIQDNDIFDQDELKEELAKAEVELETDPFETDEEIQAAQKLAKYESDLDSAIDH